MKVLKIILVLTLCLVLVPVVHFAEECDEPPLAPWFYLMTNGFAEWNYTVSDENVIEVRTEMVGLDWLNAESDSRLLYDAGDCCELQLNGMNPGKSDVILSYGSSESCYFGWTLNCTVDLKGNVFIELPLLLPSNPSSGFTWAQEKNGAVTVLFGDLRGSSSGLTGEGGSLPVSFESSGDYNENPVVLVYRRSFEENNPAVYLEMNFSVSDDDTEHPFRIYDFFLNVPLTE